jgi:hypothetical protein
MADTLSLLDYVKSRDKDSDEEDTVVTPSLPTQPASQDGAGSMSLSDYASKRDGDTTATMFPEVEEEVDEDPTQIDMATFGIPSADEDPVPEVEPYDPSFRSGADRLAEAKEYSGYILVKDESGEDVGKLISEATDEEIAAFGKVLAKDIRSGEGTYAGEADPVSKIISTVPDGGALGTKVLLKLANYINIGGAAVADGIEDTLEKMSDQKIAGYFVNKLYEAASVGRNADISTPKELTDLIVKGTSGALEFSETLPAVGALGKYISAIKSLPDVVADGLVKKTIKETKQKKIAERYNVGGARIATMEAAEDARIAAAKVADANKDIAQELIIAFEDKVGRTVSKEVDGVKTLDFDLAREAGEDIARTVTERDGELFDLALGDDVITDPILQPDKFNGIVAIASDLKRKNPEAFNNNKTIIDNLFELTVNKDLIGGQELIDDLNRYGLSFEDYVLTVASSGSKAGKVLNQLSQIARIKPDNIKADAKQKELLEQQGNIRNSVMRVENVRRGLLVSQIATAARNLTSGGVRAPLEGLGNVMDNALYEFSQPIGKGTGGFLGAGKQIVSGENWKDSFRHMKYMFDRPDVAKAYTDLVLEQPQLESQYNRMFNNLNEIQELTGRGKGGAVDNVLSGLEDVTDVLNTPNRWQEYLIRRGAFFGELERLTKREYKIDLIDALQDGKLNDLLNDASSVKPEGARSFVNIVDDAVTKSLDITYAKQPDIPVFRSTSQFITRNGLTVVMPFPRFMFNSMELMGQYAGGASIPLTKKMTELVTLGKYKAPITAKDRQRISRNLVGMAAVGAAYQYRTSEEAPAEFNQVSVSDETQADTLPLYPVPQYLYLGEATKRLEDGTFNDWFDAKEFVETFAGTNLRTGTSNAILEEVSAFADATDLTKGEAMGRLAGRTLGNYLGTWAVPFAQVIEAQRAAGVRGLTYKDAAEDPTLDFMGTFKRELVRPMAQRGVLTTPEEEAELPERSFLFAEDTTKKRVMPLARFGLGLNLSEKDNEAGEYLAKMGFKDYKLGSTSKVPSIKRFENKLLGDLVPTVVEAMQGVEEYYRNDYAKQSDKFKEKVKEEKYVNTNLKPLIKTEFTAIKTALREGSIKEGDEYTRAIVRYRNLRPDLRKMATLDFYKYFPDEKLNVLNTDHINKLIGIAEARK